MSRIAAATLVALALAVLVPAGATEAGARRDRCAPVAELTGRTDACHARISGQLRFNLATAFGELHMATCTMDQTLRADGRGRLRLEDTEISGGGFCADVAGCSPSLEQPAEPWGGRLASRGGKRYLDLNACFDICIGVFEGPLRLQLRPTGPYRSAVAIRSKVGDSGLVLDGSLVLEPPGRQTRDRP